MRALMKGAITWARERAEKGEPLDAERTLELLESHENLRTAYEDALLRAAGHSYATGMAEAGEDIQRQELELERREHAGTRGELRRFETILSRLAEWTHTFGAELKPKGADTYGEGVRDSKERVARILASTDTSTITTEGGNG